MGELGRILKKKGWSRRQFVVSTKVYWDKTEQKALSRKEIIESVRDSLKNLQLDYIDLLIVHKNDPNCPLEEVLRAMNYLINSGQIMYWGTAKWSPVEIFETFSMARSLLLKTRGSVFSIHKTSRQERKIQQGWHRHGQPPQQSPAPPEVDQCHHGRYRQGPVQQAQPARDGVHASAKMGGHRRNATSVKGVIPFQIKHLCFLVQS